MDILSYIFFIVTDAILSVQVFLRPVFDLIYAFSKFFYDIFFVFAAVLSIILILVILFVHFTKKSAEEKSFDLKEAPFVTIQIPTKNELVALECAERCLDFDYPKNKIEILIGDDSDNKEISKKINEFAEKHGARVKVVRRETNVGFKPGNLNNMLKHTNGEIIVVFDSDFAPERDFLKRIVAPFITDRNVSAVQAKWDFSNYDQNLTTRMASLLVYFFQDISLRFSLAFGLGYLCGSAEALRRKDLLALGGWKSGCLTEDIEYSLRLHSVGKKIVFLDKLSCFNQVPQFPRDLYKQQMRWAHGIISAYMINARNIIFSPVQSRGKKIVIFYNALAYFFSIVFMFLFVFGIVSIITHAPAPFDFVQFFSQLGFDMVFTSGFTICCLYILIVEKKLSHFPKTILGSFSVALPVNFFINVGVFKALARKPMPWYLLNKKVKDN